MKIIESILTKNDCYTANKQIAVKGLMLHSVGCPQPSAAVFVKNWNVPKPNGQVCVHGFIDGNTGDVYQTLPWNWRGWHCGSGANGSGNNTHIGVEMCEPASIKYTSGANFTDNNPENTKAVVMRTYKSAVELFAKLCGDFKLDPLADGVIVSHKEGCARGIASNHGDPEHLWGKFGLTMVQFRKDVKTAMTQTPTQPFKGTAIMSAAVATAEQMAAYLVSKNPASASYAAEYAKLFITEGANEGLRGDVAFAQSCLETGNFKFGGDVKPEQNNFAGIGATGGGNPGNSFKTPQEGIRAQIQHLKAYASTKALNLACVDPRFNLVTRGCAEFVEWLGQKENPNGKGWAVGADYGAKILTILNAIIAVKVEPPKPEPPAVSDWARDAWEWAKKNGICDGTRPKDTLTREEAVTLIYRLYNLK